MSAVPMRQREPIDSLEPGGSDRDFWRGSQGDRRAAVLNSGQWILLAVLTVFFLLFASAYLMRMRHGDWLVLPEPALLWGNTLLLVISSTLLQFSANGWSSRRRQAWWLFHTAGLLALLFLAGQLWVWRQIAASGYFAPDNPATAFFFLLTGLHALHLLVGLALWLRVSYRAAAGHSITGIAHLARYWHFLLLVWLFLLGLFVLT